MRVGLVSVLTTLLSVAIATPLSAAERVYVRYGAFEVSLSVTELEAFAETGEADLPYVDRLSPQQQDRLRSLLQAQFQVNAVTLSRMLYTATGERLLGYAGELLQSRAGRNGFSDIRAAAVLAAADPEGLSIVSFLRHFPTDLQVDVAETLRFGWRVLGLVAEINLAVDRLHEAASAQAAAEPAIDFSQLPDLRQSGQFSVSQQTLDLYDASRDRPVVTDLYLPDTAAPVPLIVVSNGIGARRDRFARLAEHLASHGFAVALPDHPGSNDRRQQDFYAGLYSLAQENWDATEFVDRPLDITFLLNELEGRDLGAWRGQLQLERVGMFGYSFGGATALALAGAEMSWEQLQQDCGDRLNVLNISVQYQCRALTLPHTTASLRDRRIGAVFLFVPFGKSLFGQAGLGQVETPVFWQAADEDPLTPLTIEQIPAFRALTTPDRYLAVSEGLPHTRVLLRLMNQLDNRDRAESELVAVTQTYLNALSLAFFRVYVAGDAVYAPFLTASYARTLNQAPYFLNLVESPPDDL